MTAVSAKYDHPSYLTRQVVGLKGNAGASGTSGYRSFPYAMKLRTIQATVQVAGTSTTLGNVAKIYSGTTPLTTFTLGSSSAATTITSADLNVVIPQGTVMSVVTGTDATGLADFTMEMYLDPGTPATWSGPNN